MNIQLKYRIINSKNTTLLQQPTKTKTTGIMAFILKRKTFRRFVYTGSLHNKNRLHHLKVYSQKEKNLTMKMLLHGVRGTLCHLYLQMIMNIY